MFKKMSSYRYTIKFKCKYGEGSLKRYTLRSIQAPSKTVMQNSRL